jgi:hypothetical protein
MTMKPDELTAPISRQSIAAARPVLTPKGWYASAALAAKAHGLNKGTASDKARRGVDGWRYAE